MPIVTGEARLFRSAKATLGESLVWDPVGDLLWCDITEGTLHRSPSNGSPFGAEDGTAALPAPVASFHRATAGGHVVSLGSRVILIDEAGVELRELAAIDHANDGMRLNEGKVDPFGRWVTGSLDPDGEPNGAIYVIDAEGGTTELIGGLGTANGFEWTPDGTTMYFTDTAVQTIYRGAYSRDTGLTDVEVFVAGEMFDGLVMDEQGYLWSGIYGGGRVIRYSSDGREDLSIPLPAPNVTSVAFGGDDLSTLFVASARENLSDQELRGNPLSGAIFAIPTATRGRLAYTFGPADAE
ncbi:sugar lactone lactonase YvrE [Glaciihabitans tibetensis]|uniref:Sugar lactone lactonase YvrE n=1 Tax=Glaciihabitans tibetensis TaxID=1266600 RepID=A0A2T0VCF8_9MICO|nr:SMP-30/gluconolactonase/LRE family protein [Glaciihabitans tibetensis]PRY67867.1 sugar lactone lactonase YvrE [Glaciihabitans tibetensis]